jgi:hypothetical protein
VWPQIIWNEESGGNVEAIEDRSIMKEKFKRIIRPATPEERRRHAEIREKVMREFPPSPGARRKDSPPGIPGEIRRAREAKGLAWYAVAKLAGIPNTNTVRHIEYGRDAQLSNVQAVAKALGLRLELVEERA